VHHATLSHLFHLLDPAHVEPKSKVEVEQVQKAYGRPQVSSGEDTNIALDQGEPRCI
jgi:hypothetical protein